MFLKLGRFGLLLLLVWFLLGLLRGTGREPVTPRFRMHRGFFGLLVLCFLAVYAYQGTWQVGGFARPEFVEFMRKYNRRADNPAKRMVRGRILDREGVVLAQDDSGRAGRRQYPLGLATGHLVGYVDPTYGMTGVEGADHAYLEGTTTASREEKARFGRNLLQNDGLQGNDLRLTLEARLQREALRLMEGKRGAVVALDPRRGDVLVMVSAPAYDPNHLVPELFAADPESSPLFNRALQGMYPPGSTFKILVAGMAIQRGLELELDCPGAGFVPAPGQSPIRDHEYYEAQRRGRTWHGQGRIGLGRALAKSSNVYFAQLGTRIGNAGLEAQIRQLGFNASYALLEGSTRALRYSPGTFPPHRTNDRGAAAQMAIGQGALLASPLGMAMIGAAVANDGRLVKPRLVVRGEPALLATWGNAAQARKLRSLLRTVVTDGTGRGADVPGLKVAGKTGTAQTPRGADHAWFLAMAPADRPTLVVVVLVEHGGFGSVAAVPVAAGVLKKAREIGWFGAPGGAP